MSQHDEREHQSLDAEPRLQDSLAPTASQTSILAPIDPVSGRPSHVCLRCNYGSQGEWPVRERFPNPRVCPACGSNTWNKPLDEFAEPSMSRTPDEPTILGVRTKFKVLAPNGKWIWIYSPEHLRMVEEREMNKLLEQQERRRRKQERFAKQEAAKRKAREKWIPDVAGLVNRKRKTVIPSTWYGMGEAGKARGTQGEYDRRMAASVEGGDQAESYTGRVPEGTPVTPASPDERVELAGAVSPLSQEPPAPIPFAPLKRHAAPPSDRVVHYSTKLPPPPPLEFSAARFQPDGQSVLPVLPPPPAVPRMVTQQRREEPQPERQVQARPAIMPMPEPDPAWAEYATMMEENEGGS